MVLYHIYWLGNQDTLMVRTLMTDLKVSITQLVPLYHSVVLTLCIKYIFKMSEIKFYQLLRCLLKLLTNVLRMCANWIWYFMWIRQVWWYCISIITVLLCYYFNRCTTSYRRYAWEGWYWRLTCLKYWRMWRLRISWRSQKRRLQI